MSWKINFFTSRVPVNYLLVNLAVADIMYASFITPQYILSHTFTHPDGVTGTVFCRLLTGGNFAWVGAASSVFTLANISIERYYAVMYPLGNKGKLTERKLMVSEWVSDKNRVYSSIWVFFSCFFVFSLKLHVKSKLADTKWLTLSNAYRYQFPVMLNCVNSFFRTGNVSLLICGIKDPSPLPIHLPTGFSTL